MSMSKRPSFSHGSVNEKADIANRPEDATATAELMRAIDQEVADDAAVSGPSHQ